MERKFVSLIQGTKLSFLLCSSSSGRVVRANLICEHVKRHDSTCRWSVKTPGQNWFNFLVVSQYHPPCKYGKKHHVVLSALGHVSNQLSELVHDGPAQTI